MTIIYYKIKKFDSFILYTEGVSDNDIKSFSEKNLDEIRSKEPTGLGFNMTKEMYFIYEWNTYYLKSENKFPFTEEDYFFQGKSNKISNVATLKVENFVGVIRFRSQIFEVHSEKMSYENVESLVDYINDKIPQLPFGFSNTAVSQAKFKKEKSESEDFNKFIYVYQLLNSGSLLRAINTILRNPLQSIESNSYYKDFSQTTDLDSENISDIFSGTSVFQKSKSNLKIIQKLKGYTPDRIKQYEHIISYNNNENQFVLFFLKLCIRILNKFSSELNLIEHHKHIGQSMFVKNLNKHKSELRRISKSRVFDGISRFTFINKSSTVLTKGAGYKEIYNFYLNIKSIPVSSIKKDDFIDLFENKSIDKLYEYAGLFYINDYLKEIYNLGTIDEKITTVKNNYSIALDERNNKIKFQYIKEGYPKATLYFQRSYTPAQGTSYAISQSPDFSLLIENGKDSFLYHFDTKFKVKVFDKIDIESESLFAKEEDLKSMHAYRDGIIGTQGAFVLYPGDNNSKIRIYNDINEKYPTIRKDFFKGIGSIPLKINSDNTQLKNFLKNLISSHNK